jgi:hypothetical protein
MSGFMNRKRVILLKWRKNMDIWGVYQYIHVRLHEQKKVILVKRGKPGQVSPTYPV